MTTATALRLRRLTVAEYQAMISSGIVREGEPIELLDGLLVEKMTRNPPHDLALTLLVQELSVRVPVPAWIWRVQCALTLATSVPEPDVAVVLGPARRYGTRHPGPPDAALVAEVADASLDVDQGEKLRLYAEAGLPVYWLLNIPAGLVEIYTQPTGTGTQATYAQQRILRPGDLLDFALGGVALPPILVADVLP